MSDKPPPNWPFPTWKGKPIKRPEPAPAEPPHAPARKRPGGPAVKVPWPY